MEGRSKFLDLSKIPLKQKGEGNIWATLVKVTQLLLVLTVVAAIVLWFLPVVQKSQALQREKVESARKIAQAVEYNRQLQQQVELLKTNPLYIERLARDKLNLGKQGEVIFRFDPYQPEPESSPTR